MKKTQMLPLAAIISGLLVGCGGGSGGGNSGGGGGVGPSTPKYTWQIIELVRESSPNSSCATFYEYEDSNNSANDYSVVARVATRGYKVLFHNEDGSIIDEHTIQGSDIPSSGKVTIDSGNVPQDGYVSLEETVGANSGDRESYQIAFQKPFLQNMILSVRQSQDGNSCLSGSKFEVEPDADTARVSVLSSGTVEYFHVSASSQIITGAEGTEPVDVPVAAHAPATEKKIVTSYSRERAANNYDTLNSYVVIDSNKVYESGSSNPDVSIMSTDVDSFDISVDSRLDHSSNGSVSTVLGKAVYSWQPIYNQTDNLTSSGYAPNDSQLSGWNVNFFANTDASSGIWEYKERAIIDGNTVAISQPSNISDFSTTSITSNGVLTTSSYTDSDWQLQRTHIRTVSDSNARPIFQSIYAVSNSSQPMMESPTESLGDLSTAKINVSLVNVDDNNLDGAFEELLSNSIDYEVMSDKNHDVNTHQYDLNGAIYWQDEIVEQQVTLSGSEVKLVSNKVGW